MTPRKDSVPVREARNGASEQGQMVIYVDPRALTPDCAGGWLLNIGELLPEIPVAMLSDFEDPQSIQEAFNLDVRGYIPTGVAGRRRGVRMVGGTFAPATALLSQSDRPQHSAGESLIEGFTQWQSQNF